MSQTAIPKPNKYDEIPYTSRAFAFTHPEHLGAMAMLFGMNPVSPVHARVLEIGCAAGGNLLPVACASPKGQFLGIDFSMVQVNQANATIKALGLTNVQILHQDILDFDPKAHGKFDYIICHGVFSWVQEPVRERILAICRESLSEQGVANISYNTYPGWKMREIIRDMMNYHAGNRATAIEKVQQSRAILDFIQKNSDPKSAFGMLLSSEVEVLKAAPDDYLLHEHLEETNVPYYFKDFMALAHKHGLNYVAETHINEMVPHFQGPEVHSALETVSGGNILLMEQYIDFFSNRRFRRTLLTHAENTPKLTRRIDPAGLKRFQIGAFFRTEPVPFSEIREQRFTDPDGRTLNSQVPVVRAALMVLSEAWPATLNFEEWVERVRVILGGLQPNDQALLDELLVKGFCGGMIRIRINPVRVADMKEEMLEAFAPTRLQALSDQNEATTSWHNTIRINDLQRVIIGLLDGQTTRAQVLDAIIAKCIAGQWTLGNQGVPVTNPAQMRALIEPVFPGALLELQKSGILVPKD